MHEHILPMKTDPVVRCYHNLAFPLCFIQGNAEMIGKDITPWLIGKYLNCVFDEKAYDNRYEICMHDWWGHEEHVIYHQHISMFKHIYINLKIDVLHMVKKIIDQECYISGYYNEKYIPGKEAFGVEDYDHDYIVYGYNDEKQVLYSVGYLANRKFVPFEIPYKNFIDGLLCTSSKKLEFNIWNFNSEFQFKADYQKIKCGFNDYITSSNSYGMQDGKSYGIDANKKFVEFIYARASLPGKKFIDDRYTRAFFEQKKIQYMCAKYLYHEKVISISNEDLDLMHDVYLKANSIYLLTIKFNMTHDKSLLKNIVAISEEINDIERIVIPKIVSSIV